jgi:hypothetical protein
MNWRKSSYSGQSGGNCVEVADTHDSRVIVRDTQEKAGPALRFPADAWRRMVNELKSGASLVLDARSVREPFSSARERFLYHAATFGLR